MQPPPPVYMRFQQPHAAQNQWLSPRRGFAFSGPRMVALWQRSAEPNVPATTYDSERRASSKSSLTPRAMAVSRLEPGGFRVR